MTVLSCYTQVCITGDCFAVYDRNATYHDFLSLQQSALCSVLMSQTESQCWI